MSILGLKPQFEHFNVDSEDSTCVDLSSAVLLTSFLKGTHDEYEKEDDHQSC